MVFKYHECISHQRAFLLWNYLVIFYLSWKNHASTETLQFSKMHGKSPFVFHYYNTLVILFLCFNSWLNNLSRTMNLIMINKKHLTQVCLFVNLFIEIYFKLIRSKTKNDEKWFWNFFLKLSNYFQFKNYSRYEILG